MDQVYQPKGLFCNEILLHSYLCRAFSEIYLLRNTHRIRLNYALQPIPTIHPKSITKSIAVIPKKTKKTPQFRIYQPDQILLFKSQFKLEYLDDEAVFFEQFQNIKVSISISLMIS